MIAVIVVGCIIGYCLLGIVGGAILRHLGNNDSADAIMGFIFGPVVVGFCLGVALGVVIGYGPFLLVKKGQDYLVKAFSGQDYLVKAFSISEPVTEPEHDQDDNDKEQMPKLNSNTAPHR